MIIPDANVLIYACDREAPQHRQAMRWWSEALAGPESIGLPWVVLLAFVRITSNPRIVENPLPMESIRELVLGWLGLPHVRVLQLSDQAPVRYLDLLVELGSAGELTTDAMIALHALEYSGTVYSNDRDFGRFPGIRWVNPLA